ncbi:MAG: hypothetical protein OXU36_14480 [Candidatus Poribacteria bacterium]|nr:hypothetical protein [Candidatus Poribacteria bacterium]
MNETEFAKDLLKYIRSLVLKELRRYKKDLLLKENTAVHLEGLRYGK